MHTCKYVRACGSRGAQFLQQLFQYRFTYRGIVPRYTHPQNPFPADPGEFICSDETEKAIPKKRIFAGNAIRSGLQKKSAAVMANLLNRR